MSDLNGAPAEACANCRYFSEPTGNHCRRHSPVAIFVGQQQNKLTEAIQPVIGSYWPQAIPDGWCGDYERGTAPERTVIASADAVEKALAGLDAEGNA